MTVAELIRELQSLDVSPDTPINFLVNDFNKAEIETIKVKEYIRVMPPGNTWPLHNEIEFYLHSEDLED